MHIILIIDDDSDDREMFCDAIKSLDKHIECREAVDGLQGIRMLKEVLPLPECIIIDLNMPRMNGMQCLTDIKQDAMLKDIPIVVYTTSKRPDDARHIKELGAVLFVTKPSKEKHIIKLFKYVLSNDWVGAESFLEEIQQTRG